MSLLGLALRLPMAFLCKVMVLVILELVLAPKFLRDFDLICKRDVRYPRVAGVKAVLVPTPGAAIRHRREHGCGGPGLGSVLWIYAIYGFEPGTAIAMTLQTVEKLQKLEASRRLKESR
ncbi:hypothetical protein Micbo1qcDRAFT_177862 [Microdochium bolleyi]|uniref:Uncharacterized protein n=1 Tax=Microdochium bolleyi TaxID=196109 RepID=A0A136IUV9_9PEZI|nr:hypothetical protein Micbo1qcDRAFT_177862 [Microdochium bolleyi]